MLPLSIAGAIAVTFAGYWKQMRAALAPSARVAGSARLRRRLAALVHRARSRRARHVRFRSDDARAQPRAAGADRDRAALARRDHQRRACRRAMADLPQLRTPRTVVLWIPIVLGYWIVVGLRASFVMPTELPAAWAFRVHARLPSASYWSGVRAAMVAFAIGPALAANALVVFRCSAGGSRRFTRSSSASPLTIAAQFASLLVDSVPFTRAYPPGHAKLKTRWQLYLLGMWAIAYLPVRIGTAGAERSVGTRGAAGEGLAVIAVLEIAARHRARKWTLPPESEFDDPIPRR